MVANFQQVIDRANSIDWFSRVSLPENSVESKLVDSYLCAMKTVDCSVVYLETSSTVSEHLKHRFDEDWMLTEDHESQRLRKLLSESELKNQIQILSKDLICQISDHVMRCADDWLGFEDTYLPKVGAGSAIEACYFHALEETIAPDQTGVFGKKLAIFERGRWPLCMSNGKYLVY